MNKKSALDRLGQIQHITLNKAASFIPSVPHKQKRITVSSSTQIFIRLIFLKVKDAHLLWIVLHYIHLDHKSFLGQHIILLTLHSYNTSHLSIHRSWIRINGKFVQKQKTPFDATEMQTMNDKNCSTISVNVGCTWVGEQDGRSIVSLQKILSIINPSRLKFKYFSIVQLIPRSLCNADREYSRKKKEDYWKEHWALFSFYQEA